MVVSNSLLCFLGPSRFFGDDTLGIAALIFGLLAYPIPWIANIFYVAAAAGRKTKRKNTKLIFNVLAIAMGSFTFFIHEVNQNHAFSEHKVIAVSVGYGFFAWYGSFIVLLIGHLWQRFFAKPLLVTPPPGNDISS